MSGTWMYGDEFDIAIYDQLRIEPSLIPYILKKLHVNTYSDLFFDIVRIYMGSMLRLFSSHRLNPHLQRDINGTTSDAMPTCKRLERRIITFPAKRRASLVLTHPSPSTCETLLPRLNPQAEIDVTSISSQQRSHHIAQSMWRPWKLKFGARSVTQSGGCMFSPQ